MRVPGLEARLSLCPHNNVHQFVRMRCLTRILLCVLQDIRRYFTAIGGSKKSDTSSHSSKEVKKRNVINDSDEETPSPAVTKTKRQRIVDSDSGVEEDCITSQYGIITDVTHILYPF